MEIVSEDRLIYLSSKVAHMHLKGVNRRLLAEIALETLVMKLELERIAKEEHPKEQRRFIKSKLKRLGELEKGIFRLYFMGRLKGEKWAGSSIFGSLARRYPYEEER